MMLSGEQAGDLSVIYDCKTNRPYPVFQMVYGKHKCVHNT